MPGLPAASVGSQLKALTESLQQLSLPQLPSLNMAALRGLALPELSEREKKAVAAAAAVGAAAALVSAVALARRRARRRAAAAAAEQQDEAPETLGPCGVLLDPLGTAKAGAEAAADAAAAPTGVVTTLAALEQLPHFRLLAAPVLAVRVMHQGDKLAAIAASVLALRELKVGAGGWGGCQGLWVVTAHAMCLAWKSLPATSCLSAALQCGIVGCVSCCRTLPCCQPQRRPVAVGWLRGAGGDKPPRQLPNGHIVLDACQLLSHAAVRMIQTTGAGPARQCHQRSARRHRQSDRPHTVLACCSWWIAACWGIDCHCRLWFALCTPNMQRVCLHDHKCTPTPLSSPRQRHGLTTPWPDMPHPPPAGCAWLATASPTCPSRWASCRWVRCTPTTTSPCMGPAAPGGAELCGRVAA